MFAIKLKQILINVKSEDLTLEISQRNPTLPGCYKIYFIFGFIAITVTIVKKADALYTIDIKIQKLI